MTEAGPVDLIDDDSDDTDDLLPPSGEGIPTCLPCNKHGNTKLNDTFGSSLDQRECVKHISRAYLMIASADCFFILCYACCVSRRNSLTVDVSFECMSVASEVHVMH